MTRKIIETKNYYFIESNTALMKTNYRWWKKSENYELWNVYKNYSWYKIRAFERCKNMMKELNGYGLRIINANCQAFTAGFQFESPINGEVCFAYITKDYSRFMYL